MLEDLIQAHRSGRFDEAESGYRQLLAEHPDDAEVLNLLGILRSQRGDVVGGIELVARAVTLAPEHAPYRFTLGEMYLSQGEIDAAAAAYEKARELNPNLAGAYTGLGRVALLRGDADTAESHFKVALRADENDVQAVAGLGDVAVARGDRERATQWLTQAAELAPNDPVIRTHYAQVMLDRGMPDFAARALDNVLAFRPDFAPALALRADVHVRKGEFAAAQSIYEATLVRSGDDAMAYAGLGDIAYAERRYAAAATQYGQALATQPAFHRAAIRQADALLQAGDADAAVDALRAQVARFPDALSLRTELAALLSRADRHDAALVVWEETAERWPADVNIKALHALELDRAGRFDAAVAMAQAAAASPLPAIALLRARGALLGGDPARAVQCLQHIPADRLDAKPRLQRRRQRLLGLAFDALEQWPDALAAFQQSHHAAPGALPALPALDEPLRGTLRAQAAEPVLEGAAGNAPVLLCGLPGSGVEQVAELLADQPNLALRRDRFASAPDFISAPFDERLVASPGQGQLAVLARHYRRPLERNRIDASAPIIDWVPVLDARMLPAINRALPGTRVIIVAREPEDMLLDWLAFGWQDMLPMPDPLTAARWLHIAGAHLKLAAHLLPAFTVDAEALLAAGGGSARRQLGEFLGGGDLTWGPRARAARKGPRGLPASFPREHAAHYRALLADAFAALGD